MVEVSVIITVYNYICDEKLDAIFKGWNNQTVNKEIILCEQSIEASEVYREKCEEYNVKYVHCKPEIREEKCLFNVGSIRNVGALYSSGAYLYFSDADILVTNNDYLKIILEFSKKHHDVPLMRPFCRRLQIEDTSLFCRKYIQCSDLINFNENEYFCNAQYNDIKMCIQPFECGENYRMIKNVPHVSIRDVNKSHSILDKKGDCESDWMIAAHCGGLFCRFNSFIAVGGFCEQYYTWGCEDIDLQWKLDGMFGIQLVDVAVKQCSIIHMEHISRCEIIQYNKNMEIFERRKKAGTAYAINIDNNNSIIAKWKNGDEELDEYVDDCLFRRM